MSAKILSTFKQSAEGGEIMDTKPETIEIKESNQDVCNGCNATNPSRCSRCNGCLSKIAGGYQGYCGCTCKHSVCPICDTARPFGYCPHCDDSED